MRDVTAAQFMQRYHVDSTQARRVATLALHLLAQVPCEDRENAEMFLSWAAKLHEIGITVAYSGYQKHGAYILSNADMPGFSRMEQERLATLVLAHRRQLRKLPDATIGEADWPLVAALRLAVLFTRSRGRVELPRLRLRSDGRRFVLDVPEAWLADNPLTENALREELDLWRGSGAELVVRVARDDASVAQLPTAA
jgi:exopolyphosphatase/guanosine-5'-triphosphate,3'-diphosphate pyrophosphatase